MKAYPPLPLDARRDFAFRLPDPEGAPADNGRRYHSAVDWFSPAGTTLYAPAAGRIIEARNTGDISGQVFGGTVTILDLEGRVWASRHVVPTVALGVSVDTGDPVGRVSQWLDWPGGTHDHQEIWRTLLGGYDHENMIDPASIDWTLEAAATTAYFFEELPFDQGGAGPKIVGNAAGYTSAGKAKAYGWVLRRRGLIVSTITAETGKTFIFQWAPDTYGKKFRFGPWSEKSNRKDLALDRAQHRLGHPIPSGEAAQKAYLARAGLRPFNGRARSLYPWPATA